MNIQNLGSILITGGTGSFGKAFIKEVLSEKYTVDRLVIFSRDELKQWEIEEEYPESKYPQIRFFLGDIRDKERLKRAFRGIETVVHAAALKQVPKAEYNPMEFIKTNVLGSENIVQACLDSEVKRVVALSTDKAAAPINLYGASKLCADKLFVAANLIKGSRDLRFSVVRYGNVMGSRGSVIPFFMKKSKDGQLPITDPNMTRFNITLREGVDIVLNTILNGCGGEIVVPKIPSYKIKDVAEAISPSAEKIIVGMRPGEKLHEEMVTSSDSQLTYDIGSKYLILTKDERLLNKIKEKNKHFRPVERGFSYNSGSNNNFLSVEQIRKLINKEIDRQFQFV